MKNFLEVADIITQVKETSSKKEKEAILTQYNTNTLLGEVLNHIFNPFVKTNIAKKKLEKEIDGKPAGEPIQDVVEYMQYLSQSTGKNEHILKIREFIHSQQESIQWLLEGMATKDLKIGATSSTINKAFGENFIPKFDLMLAEKYVEAKKVKVKGETVIKIYEHWRRYIGKRIIATKKLDGNRVAIFVRAVDDVKLYTREGHEIEGCLEIEEAFSSFPSGMVYDGEILATNEEGLNSKDLFKKTSKIMKKKGLKTGLEFHAFDMLPIEDFKKGGFDTPVENRKIAVEKIISLHADETLIKYVSPLYVGDFDFDLIEQLADEAKQREEEGIMVQLADAPYECKRTFSILKVKSFESADIKCLDIYEGKKGKNIGKLGGLVLEFKGYPVNVGGGYSDEQRVEIWSNPDMVIGKIIEIQYFEEFLDDDGSIDLRFATFKTIRDDKTEESYY